MDKTLIPGAIGTVTSSRWYCWTSCKDVEGTDPKDPSKCDDQLVQWPPRFCTKGSEGCVGPYMRKFK